MRARFLLFGFATLGACSGPEVTKLPGAVRAEIPVFEPSTVEESDKVEFSTGEDFDTIANFEALTWRLSTARPLAEVIGFYAKLAAAEVEAPVVDTTVGENPFVEARVVEGTDWQLPLPSEDENVDHAPAAGGDGSRHEFASMPRRVFRLPEQKGSAVEVSIYLQPRQRLFWFAITETVPVAN